MVAEDLRKDFMDTFIPYGYKPFWPAGLQLLEAITAKVNANLQNRLVVTNSFHGEPCALRADITLGVVDYCASHFEAHERPLRLCYTERIYRRPKSPDKNMERLQMGAELIGWEGAGADVELIGLLLAYLNKLNCPKIGIALGDVSLIQRAIKYLPRAYAMSLLGCLEEGKMDEYARIARDLPPSPLSIFFEELPWLKGNAEILYRASRLLKGVEEAIEPLKSIYAELVKMGYGDCIVIDLSLVRELDYYSGPIFDVYFEDTGIPIGGGGRYDTCLNARHVGPSCWLCADLEVLALNTAKPTTEHKNTSLGAGSQPASVLACAKEITSLGYYVEILWRERAPEVSELAKKGLQSAVELKQKSITDLFRRRDLSGRFSWRRYL